MKIKHLKSVADVKLTLEGLEVGGGIKYTPDRKILPMSKKAKDLVQHLWTLVPKSPHSQVWSWLADEAEWDMKIAEPERAKQLFSAPMVMIPRSGTVSRRPSWASTAERQPGKFSKPGGDGNRRRRPASSRR